MKAILLGRHWILIACLLSWDITPAFAFGEYIEGSVIATKRVAVVDSSSYAALFTSAGTLSLNTIFTGTHFLLDDGNFRTAGGPWIGNGEYVGYIRTPSQEGRCYRAMFDAFYGTAYQIVASSPVCIPYHSSDCGHCEPGTGTPCTLDTEQAPE